MDASTTAALTVLAKVLTALGPSGVWTAILGVPMLMLLPVLILTLVYARRQAELLEAYRKDTQDVLREYGQAVDRLGQYYKDNVILVKNYERITNDLHSVVMLNTQTMQRLCDRIEGATKK